MKYSLVALFGMAALAAPAISQTVTGTLTPIAGGISITQQFASPATIGAGAEFTGQVQDNYFGQTFNVAADFSGNSLSVNFSGPNGNENIYGIDLLELTFETTDWAFPGVLSVAETCGSLCNGNSHVSYMFTDGHTIDLKFAALAAGASYTLNFGAAAPAPEPASWALMLGGFGLVGATLRRRKIAVSFA